MPDSVYAWLVVGTGATKTPQKMAYRRKKLKKRIIFIFNHFHA
jgi:hypothetical protein